MTAKQQRRRSRDQKIAALRELGVSERTIGVITSLSASRVHSILEDLGVRPPVKSEREKISASPVPSLN
jgi:hypothetical protein